MSGGGGGGGSDGRNNGNNTYTYREVPGTTTMGNWNTGGQVVGTGNTQGHSSDGIGQTSSGWGNFSYAPGYNGPISLNGGQNWGGQNGDFKSLQDRMVARPVNTGAPDQITQTPLSGPVAPRVARPINPRDPNGNPFFRRPRVGVPVSPLMPQDPSVPDSVLPGFVPPAPQAQDTQMRSIINTLRSLKNPGAGVYRPSWTYNNPTNPNPNQFGPRNVFNPDNNVNSPNPLNNYNVQQVVNGKTFY